MALGAVGRNGVATKIKSSPITAIIDPVLLSTINVLFALISYSQ
jgi:hypothetical protein